MSEEIDRDSAIDILSGYEDGSVLRIPNAGECLAMLIGEDFSDVGRVHDWRNHIPEELVDKWEQLSLQTRAAIYVIAEIAAGQEHWD